MNDKKYQYVQLARKLATFSDVKNHRHGCVIVRDNKVISTGFNHWKSSDKTVHAEMDAISKLKKTEDLRNCELYVVRIGTDLMNCPLKYSRPCEACSACIVKRGIRRIYYSINDDTSVDMPWFK